MARPEQAGVAVAITQHEKVDQMEPQRIILANIPRLLEDMLKRAFAYVSSLQIVDEVADWACLPAAIQQTNAQWVIVSLPSSAEATRAVSELLASHPAIRVLNVATDGSHVTLQWIEPRAQTIDDFSLGELVALLTSPPAARLPTP